MKTTYFYFIALFTSILLFSSFSSENNSEILPKKEVSETKIIPQKKILAKSKKQKISFKERIALKLIKKKIKKTQKKQTKNINSQKKNGEGLITTILISAFLILAGLVSGVVFLAIGKTLLGILLLIGGLIFVPLVMAAILLILHY